MTGAPADRTQPPVQMQNVTTCSPLFCGASSARLRRQMAAAVRASCSVHQLWDYQFYKAASRKCPFCWQQDAGNDEEHLYVGIEFLDREMNWKSEIHRGG